MNILALFFVINSISAIVLKDYCKLNVTNSPCKYQCKKGSGCGNPEEKFSVLTDLERMLALDEHNKYRNEVAGGKYKEYFLEPAKNLPALNYDKELEFVIGCYLKQCIFDHDSLRMGLKGNKMGQNLYTTTFSKKKTDWIPIITRAITAWFEEYKLLTKENVEKGGLYTGFIKAPKGTGHLTQMLWENSTLLGCAKIHYIKREDKYTYDFACNYSPQGNYRKRLMYQTGEPFCDIVNNRYNKLCGVIRPLADDKYEYPTDLTNELESKDGSGNGSGEVCGIDAGWAVVTLIVAVILI